MSKTEPPVDLEAKLILPLFFTGFFSVYVIGMDSKDTDFLRKLSDKAAQSPKAGRWIERTNRARSIFGKAAVALLAGAIIVNVCSWISSGIAQQGFLLVSINAGISIVFFGALVLERWRWRTHGSRSFSFSAPGWCKAALAAILVYILSAFTFNGIQSYQDQHGNGGNVQLELTPAQHARIQQRMVRGVSNIWILLSSLSATGLLFAQQKEPEGPFGKFNSVLQKL